MITKYFCLLSVLLTGMTAAFASDIPDFPSVFVVGKAEIDAPPDIATCSLTLRAREQDAAKAASIVDDRLKSVLATLKTNDIAVNDIESFNIQKQVLTNEGDDASRSAIRGYDVWRNIQFTSRHLESVPPIEASLVKSANIVNISCRFDRTDRETVEADLMIKALHTARDEADKLAAPLGRHITGAVAISKTPFESIASSFGFGSNYAAMEKVDRMFKKSVATDGLSGDDLLVPSSIHISVSVNVLFKME